MIKAMERIQTMETRPTDDVHIESISMGKSSEHLAVEWYRKGSSLTRNGTVKIGGVAMIPRDEVAGLLAPLLDLIRKCTGDEMFAVWIDDDRGDA